MNGDAWPLSYVGGVKDNICRNNFDLWMVSEGTGPCYVGEIHKS